MLTMFAFDQQIQQITRTFFEMVRGHAIIVKIAKLLNAPTRRKQLLKGTLRRYRLMHEHRATHPNFDERRITLCGVKYYYTDDDDNPTFTLGPLNLDIEQGQTVAVQAAAHTGKQTFLKLLGRLILPADGFVWYPENLRVRYLSESPVLFHMTVAENLRFGNQHELSDDEIWDVCGMLGIGYLRQDADMSVGTSGERLSLSERALICIARALLSSVNILLLSNSLDNLTSKHVGMVFSVLSNMVENKGLPYELKGGTSLASRKNKTVFLITTKVEVEEKVDSTVSLIPQKKRLLSKKQQVTKDRLERKEAHRKKQELLELTRRKIRSEEL
eukprot:TRINITY_DN10940_c0_g1_i1.p1 TRINITY_DN10940_c0_g1~~TRINITY_DN10940_c0_g1_i1.p1  ORF type:complete len:330 (-),score=65.91 TRINITY_DN10940_c0_g1_i1:219-1208(-)